MSNPADTTPARLATIARAVELLDTARPSKLRGWIARSDIIPELKDDRDALRRYLAGAKPGCEQLFSRWKTAQALLGTAGQSYLTPGDGNGAYE